MGRVGGFYFLFLYSLLYFFPIENGINVSAQFKKNNIINFDAVKCLSWTNIWRLVQFLLLADF